MVFRSPLQPLPRNREINESNVKHDQHLENDAKKTFTPSCNSSRRVCKSTRVGNIPVDAKTPSHLTPRDFGKYIKAFRSPSMAYSSVARNGEPPTPRANLKLPPSTSLKQSQRSTVRNSVDGNMSTHPVKASEMHVCDMQETLKKGDTDRAEEAKDFSLESSEINPFRTVRALQRTPPQAPPPPASKPEESADKIIYPTSSNDGNSDHSLQPTTSPSTQNQLQMDSEAPQPMEFISHSANISVPENSQQNDSAMPTSEEDLTHDSRSQQIASPPDSTFVSECNADVMESPHPSTKNSLEKSVEHADTSTGKSTLIPVSTIVDIDSASVESSEAVPRHSVVTSTFTGDDIVRAVQAAVREETASIKSQLRDLENIVCRQRAEQALETMEAIRQRVRINDERTAQIDKEVEQWLAREEREKSLKTSAIVTQYEQCESVTQESGRKLKVAEDGAVSNDVLTNSVEVEVDGEMSCNYDDATKHNTVNEQCEISTCDESAQLCDRHSFAVEGIRSPINEMQESLESIRQASSSDLEVNCGPDLPQSDISAGVTCDEENMNCSFPKDNSSSSLSLSSEITQPENQEEEDTYVDIGVPYRVFGGMKFEPIHSAKQVRPIGFVDSRERTHRRQGCEISAVKESNSPSDDVSKGVAASKMKSSTVKSSSRRRMKSKDIETTADENQVEYKATKSKRSGQKNSRSHDTVEPKSKKRSRKPKSSDTEISGEDQGKSELPEKSDCKAASDTAPTSKTQRKSKRLMPSEHSESVNDIGDSSQSSRETTDAAEKDVSDSQKEQGCVSNKKQRKSKRLMPSEHSESVNEIEDSIQSSSDTTDSVDKDASNSQKEQGCGAALPFVEQPTILNGSSSALDIEVPPPDLESDDDIACTSNIDTSIFDEAAKAISKKKGRSKKKTSVKKNSATADSKPKTQNRKMTLHSKVATSQSWNDDTEDKLNDSGKKSDISVSDVTSVSCAKRKLSKKTRDNSSVSRLSVINEDDESHSSDIALPPRKIVRKSDIKSPSKGAADLRAKMRLQSVAIPKLKKRNL